MRDAHRIPSREKTQPAERPFLYAPQPAYMEPCPMPEHEQEEEEEAPRVIIIDI